MRAAVTGASGFVGSHLVETLLAEGWGVTCVLRETSPLEWLASLPVERRVASLIRPDTLRAAFEGADVVFHVAGLIKALDPADYTRVNVVGARNVTQAAGDAGVRRLVFVSSQAVAGPASFDRPAAEGQPPRPVSLYGQSKAEAERELLGFASPLEVVIVRPAVVYGPRDRALQPLFRAIRWRVAPSLPGDPAISLIHARDLARCLIAASVSPNAPGRVYFAAADPVSTFSHLVALIGDALGGRPLEIPVPAVVLLLAGAAADLVSKLTRTARPFGRQKAREMLQAGWACSTSRARDELGFVASTPHAEGLEETARWYRRNGWI